MPERKRRVPWQFPTRSVRAPEDAAERLQPGAEVGFAAMVLEADQGWRVEAQAAGLDHDVADVAACSGDGVQVDQPQAGQFLAVRGHVVLAQQLVAAADRKHHRAAVNRFADRRHLVLGRIAKHQLLVSVLAPAPEDQVDTGQVGSRASPDGFDGDRHSPPLGPLG